MTVSGLSAAMIALAGVWLLTALAAAVAVRRLPLAAVCATVAATQLAAVGWTPLSPIVASGWLAYALAAPSGRLGTPVRRFTVVVGALTGAAGAASTANGWSALKHDSTTFFIVTAAVVAAIGIGAAQVRGRQAVADDRASRQWVSAGWVLAIGIIAVVSATWLVVGLPDQPLPWLVTALVFVPAGQLCALRPRRTTLAARALIESIAVVGMASFVTLVYLVVVAGINGVPAGHEKVRVLSGVIVGIAVALVVLPMRGRLVAFAGALVGPTAPSVEEVGRTFSARMSRAVPFDELLLQLAELLHASIAISGAEIWTGTGGLLTRAVGLPERGGARLALDERTQVVVRQMPIAGRGWSAIWLPDLLGPAGTDLRIAPIAHRGELLGLIVIRWPADATGPTDSDERGLVEVARQLGLALFNVGLDTALQASLAELALRNTELQASRLRIVAAADTTRRTIERDLHDGAQQHLVALAVKVSLAQQVAEDGDLSAVHGLLTQLRAEVQTTITELRELAHGIYPPLLRDRGLGDALRTAVTRLPMAHEVNIDLAIRFVESVETAAYFCCLEAMQNSAKYAGPDASIYIDASYSSGSLCIELRDDGAGFDVATARHGHGFLNMRDRLGAIGGDLLVESTPGTGTAVRVVIPAQPLSPTT
jgi:signal transduction histidine kinase